jgi:hypothetical protein
VMTPTAMVGSTDIRRSDEMNGYETWANLNVLVREKREEYVSRDEYLRRERVAVGRICRCGTCLCCDEWHKDNNANNVRDKT